MLKHTIQIVFLYLISYLLDFPVPSGDTATSSGQELHQGFPTTPPAGPSKGVGTHPQSQPALPSIWMQTGVHYPEVCRYLISQNY